MSGRAPDSEPETIVSATLPKGRCAGIGMHFVSLPGPFGIGDIGDAARGFLDTLVAMNIGVWQFLPTGPTAYGNSPYQPLSAFAGNEMLIGIEPLLRQGLLTRAETAQLTTLPADRVDYASLIPLKRNLLSMAANRFRESAGSELRARYEDFLQAHDAKWLGDYAVYRVLKSQHGEKPWPDWDAAYARREPGAMRRALDVHRDGVARIKVLQFLFDDQWQALKQRARELGISLFGDMPIYIALDSSDAWAHPEILLIDAAGRPRFVAGVPPDYFSAEGQLWGNPLYDWRHHELEGYTWWIERMRHAITRLDLVRIDHFRGFEAYWSVPAGASTARDGEWLKGPADGLFDALREALGRLPIVAEDLGVITPEVEALRLRHGIPGMKVLQFDVADEAFSPAAIPQDCVCYTGTHDNDTTVGWFHGGRGDTRSSREIRRTQDNVLRLTGGSPGTVHLDMIRLAFGTGARLSIAPLQDLLGLGSNTRFNTPGTTRDNWCWRVRKEQLTPAVTGAMAKLVNEAGRAPRRA